MPKINKRQYAHAPYIKPHLERQAERDRRNEEIIAMNERIKKMVFKGTTLSEIMAETGMGANYIRVVGGADLNHG